MHGVVKIHGLNAIYFLREVPAEGDDWEVVEGAWVEVPPDIADWPIGVDRPPPPTLAVSKTDPKKYRMFKRPEEVEPAGFEPTGRSYGGGLFAQAVGTTGRGDSRHEGLRCDPGERPAGRDG